MWYTSSVTGKASLLGPDLSPGLRKPPVQYRGVGVPWDPNTHSSAWPVGPRYWTCLDRRTKVRSFPMDSTSDATEAAEPAVASASPDDVTVEQWRKRIGTD